MSHPLTRPPVLFGAILLALLVILVLFADLLSPGDPWRMVARPNLPPLTPGHFFGTDMLGRDLTAGLIHGARATLLVALAVALLSLGIGVAVGLTAGYAGGLIDEALMRITEFFQTIPGFLLTVIIVAILSPKPAVIIGAITLISWPAIARIVRAEVSSLRQSDWLAAARLSGLSHSRIAIFHIGPNVIPQVMIQGSLVIASAIMIESGISFLGLGSRDAISWGFLLGSGRTAFSVNWWLPTLPGLAIFLTILAFNLLADGVERWLHPGEV